MTQGQSLSTQSLTQFDIEGKMMIVGVMGYRVKHSCRVGFILKLCPTLEVDRRGIVCVSLYIWS